MNTNKKGTDAVCYCACTIIEKREFVPGSPPIFFKDPDGYTIEILYEVLENTPDA